MGADCIYEVNHFAVNVAVGHGVVHGIGLDTVIPVALASNGITSHAVPLYCELLRGHIGHCREIRDAGLATVQGIAVHLFQGKPHRADIGNSIPSPREACSEGYAVGVDDCALGCERERGRGPVNFKRHLVAV